MSKILQNLNLSNFGVGECFDVCLDPTHGLKAVLHCQVVQISPKEPFPVELKITEHSLAFRRIELYGFVPVTISSGVLMLKIYHYQDPEKTDHRYQYSVSGFRSCDKSATDAHFDSNRMPLGFEESD